MKKRNSRGKSGEFQPEYDFSHGVRGKYAKRYAKGSNLILLDPDVASVFPDEESVNYTLRTLAKIIRKHPAKSPATS